MTDIFVLDRYLTPDGILKKQYPDIDGYFDCSATKITTLVGSPVNVGKFFTCSNTKLTSLTGAPMIVGKDFFGSNTSITSLQGIGRDYLQEIGRSLYLNGCPDLKSNMLGIMLVNKLKEISFNLNKEIQDIFNRHLSGDRDLLDCKEELMNAGFKEFAKL